MKVCCLLPSYAGSNSVIKDYDPIRDLAPYLESPEDSLQTVFLCKNTVNKTVRRLVREGTDVFVNLCDGAWDEDVPGVDVVLALEHEKVPFTGANTFFYDPSRELMKKVCYAYGVPTPDCIFAYDENGISEALKKLKFPMFVKHHQSYNSVGITSRSKVNNAEELRERVKEYIENYEGALIEQYIDGREFSVLVASNPKNEEDPLVFIPVECLFLGSDKFKTFEMKWNTKGNPWRACEDSDTNALLFKYSKEVFRGLCGEGYGRLDFRMDQDGKIYFLEINPNCSVFYNDPDCGATADLILRFDGTGQAGFLKHIIEYAMYRWRRDHSKPVEVRNDPMFGNSLHAARDIKAGEIVHRLEEREHVLVTKQWVDEHWSPSDKVVFSHFAYPISDEVWCLWSKNPEDWRPINHSCDPNAWVTGLNLTSRRDIRKGEQLTFDYATMYLRPMVKFQCLCGSKLCRGMWSEQDHLQPWFLERYGLDHVTPYVRSIIRSRRGNAS